MPASFAALGSTVRKVDITQITNALTSGSTTYGVPLNVAVNSSSTALKLRQNGAGNILELLKDDGSTVFSIDSTGSITQISYGAGSESSPGITQDGDADTGQYKPDVDRIAWAFAGTKLVDWRAGTLEFLDTVAISQGTLTADAQALSITGVWNDGAEVFTGIKAVYTDTASDAASLLLDLHAGSTPASVFSVGKDGSLTAAGNAQLGGYADLAEIASPATPASGFVRLFSKSDGLVYRKDDAGTEAPVGGANCRSVAAESLTAVSGCDHVLRGVGTTRYELGFVHTTDGHASMSMTVPQTYAGGTITFKGWVWTTAASATVWRVYGVVIGDGDSADTAWGALDTDQTVTSAGSNALKPFTVSWTVAASAAGKQLTLAVQRMAVASGADTYGDVAYFRAMDIKFGT